MYCNIALYENIVSHIIISSSSNHQATSSLVDHIAINIGATSKIIQINGLHISHVQIMEIVIANKVTTLRIIPPHVKGTGIAGLQAYMMNLVVFDNVFIAMQKNGGVRGIVNLIVGYKVTHTINGNTRVIGSSPLTEIVDAIVDGKVTSGGQRFTITAG